MMKIERIELPKENTDYEKDPRFVEYMKMLLELSRDRSRLMDGRKALAAIRKKYGLGA
jgi:hypothetical protein